MNIIFVRFLFKQTKKEEMNRKKSDKILALTTKRTKKRNKTDLFTNQSNSPHYRHSFFIFSGTRHNQTLFPFFVVQFLQTFLFFLSTLYMIFPYIKEKIWMSLGVLVRRVFLFLFFFFVAFSKNFTTTTKK